MTETIQKNLTSVPDNLYDTLFDRAKNERFLLKNTKGDRREFFIKQDHLFAIDPDTNTLSMVVTESIVKQLTEEYRPAKNPELKEELIKQIREQNPMLSDEDVDLNADVMVEADRSLNNLVALGLPREKAILLIKEALKNE